MKIILSSVAVLAVVCSFAPASLAAPQTAKGAKTTEAPADPDKQICKRIEVKSKMPSAVVRKERVCHTQAEWDEQLKVNDEQMKKYKDAFRDTSAPQ
jgi:hypothetical protein